MIRYAIIPARGGSERIPRKNIKLFFGKPAIAWPIKAALDSGCFDKVIVSTDDKEIKSIAEDSGAFVPFIRPANLSTSRTATRPVINHAIDMINRKWQEPNYVCCIYPVTPFLDSEDLIKSFNLIVKRDCDFVFSAGQHRQAIKRSFRIKEDGAPERLWPEHRFTRSQDLENTFFDAGQFYWGTTEAFLKNLDPVSERGLPYVLSAEKVHDIDTVEDWDFAEIVYKGLKS